MSPFNLPIYPGPEMLHLRVRETQNTLEVAQFLADHPSQLCHHPSLQSGEDKARADKYMSGGYGAWSA